MTAHLRAILEYESDFWVLAGATFLTQVVNLVFLSAIFARVPTLRGWSYWAVVTMFGLVALTEGVGSFFFEGTWRVAEAINKGTLDYMMVRPYPVVLQLTSSEIGINGLTNMLAGSIMIGVALAKADISWSAERVLLGLVLLISAIIIKLAINLATNSVSFWLNSPSAMFATAIHQVGELAKFPLTIYPAGLKVALGVIIPFAFITTFPVGLLLQTGPVFWLGLLTPVVAVYCLTVALAAFFNGLRRYESAGN
ncbi:ABC-2 family transporter protein [Actinoplanes sp. KI2]|uniref:ABC transporter permease n=1 Tax=Actinoplanes sp. KI2 TaxID=2983315 RepID=UPI0021D56C21|nr:ABC-2 family transporter protein [Actinoplanes sp. KI2]MCU7725967.1 ABC-2 family transporter protein [Actinoplanes sp. KI2]